MSVHESDRELQCDHVVEVIDQYRSKIDKYRVTIM